MEELAEFQNRLGSLKESLGERDIEDLGTVELATLREALTNLLGEVDAYVKECRLDDKKYDDEEAVEIMFSGLKTKNQIGNLRSEIISELLLKESRIDSLSKEEKQILGLEESLSGFTVADELNMTDVERAVMNLSSTFPKRKEEISKEIDELKNGRTTKKEKKSIIPSAGGAHLAPEKEEEKSEEVNNAIDGVDFNEPDDSSKKEEEVIPLNVPSQLEEDGLLKPPAERTDVEKEEIPPMLGVSGSELDGDTTEKPEEEKEEAEEETKTEEDEDKDDEFSRIPIPVTEIVQPKPALWQKVGLAITGAIGFMATAIAIHTGLGARYLRNLSNNNEATVQEEIEVTPEEETKAEEEVVSDVVDTVQQDYLINFLNI